MECFTDTLPIKTVGNPTTLPVRVSKNICASDTTRTHQPVSMRSKSMLLKDTETNLNLFSGSVVLFNQIEPIGESTKRPVKRLKYQTNETSPG